MKINFKNTNISVNVDKPKSIIDILVHENKRDVLKNVLFALINNKVFDLMTEIDINQGKLIDIELISDPNHPRFFEVMNHSCAHILAAAVLNLWPKTNLWVGPAINEGFYYDMELPCQITHENLLDIEKEMQSILASKPKFIRESKTKSEMLEMFKGNPFKVDLIRNISDNLTIYKTEKFYDLCRGPHVIDSKWLKNFKLLSITGAYFKGDSTKQMLTRIYGTCWQSKEKLEEYLKLIELRKERDHRKIGKEMKLFMFSPLAGQGLAIWLPNGMEIRSRMSSFIKNIEKKYDFLHVSTPALGSVELYKTSGHWSHYRKNMYPEIVIDDEHLVLRPMSCPHHCLIYKHELRSYRDLPLRLAEEVLQHRYEASGALSGLERVRAMNLTDAHIFTAFDNLKSEICHLIKMIQEILNKFGIEIDYYRLSLRDPEDKVQFFPDDKMWNDAESILRDTLDSLGIKYVEAKGEAAFYGPKIDVQVKTILGHEITSSTLQLDFLLPNKFDLTFINSNGEKERPVILHRGLIGTYERFLSILIEQTNGVFPLWLAPVQFALIPIHSSHVDYCKEIAKELKNAEFTYQEYYDDNRLGYRLRDAQISKIPYQIIIGDEEIKNHTLQIRKYGSKDSTKISKKELLSYFKDVLKK